MKTRLVDFLSAALFVSAAFGQSSKEQSLDRTLRFTHTESSQNMQEIAVAVRAITDISQAAVDIEQKLLMVHGTAGQIALAEWLFNELDQANRQSRQSSDKYLMPGGDRDNVVRVFYLQHVGTVQSF